MKNNTPEFLEKLGITEIKDNLNGGELHIDTQLLARLFGQDLITMNEGIRYESNRISECSHGDRDK